MGLFLLNVLLAELLVGGDLQVETEEQGLGL